MIKECDDFFKLFMKRNTSRLLKNLSGYEYSEIDQINDQGPGALRHQAHRAWIRFICLRTNPSRIADYRVHWTTHLKRRGR